MMIEELLDGKIGVRIEKAWQGQNIDNILSGEIKMDDLSEWNEDFAEHPIYAIDGTIAWWGTRAQFKGLAPDGHLVSYEEFMGEEPQEEIDIGMPNLNDIL